MTIFENSLFTNDDFLQIENVLYTAREEEMIARTLLRMNTSYASFSEEIGYDYYSREGSAKVLAKGGGSSDIPFVNEKGGRHTQRVYDIATGIRWTRAEQEAIAAKRAQGKGPSVQLDTLRVESARRFIFEKENQLTFVGDSDWGIKGLFDDTFYTAGKGTKTNVAASGTGATTAAKRLWANKTPQNILADLRTGMETVETDGLFKARTLVLSPGAMNQLRQPYSDQNPMTLMSWLQSEGMYFDEYLTSRVMKSGNNDDTVDYFMILDNDPEVVELAIIEDINLLDPVYDIVRTMEQAVIESYGGILFRHPAGAYIGKGI